LEEAGPGIRIDCGSDIQNVIYCCSSPDNCIAVISGTGTVVYSSSGGVLMRTGGAGYRFEGGGSGYDIGRDAISAALAERDGTGEPTLLTPMVEEKLGGNVWDEIHTLYLKDVAGIADFAPIVSRAAGKGDRIALKILENNSSHLARLIGRAWELAPAVRTVIFSGSMLMKDELFYRMVAEKISAQLTAERMTMPVVWGACLKCARMCGVEKLPSAALFSGEEDDR
jgi:N-acetylglucosamine kinase-like BadF-type ATPase